MNYQHHFHAGSAADVFKHLVLLAVLEHFKQKDKSFCYVDLFAGKGVYDLSAKGITEWHDGLERLQKNYPVLKKPKNNPLLEKYLTLCENTRAYPGSPMIARQSIRPQDEIILVEKTENIYLELKKLFARDPQTHAHHLDAQTAAKALLPPHIRRGIVLVDPAYEAPDELKKLPEFIASLYARWQTACYLIWYPIKLERTLRPFYQTLRQVIPDDKTILGLEFCPWPSDVALRLNGSGILMINPPWHIEKALKPLLSGVLAALQQHPRAYFRHFLL